MLLVVSVVAFTACDKMNDIQSKYRNEAIYSGKVSNVRGYAGIERASIAWDNPVDYKSRKIYIEYYAFADSVETFFRDDVFDENTSRITLDSLSFSGLNHDASYTFKIYTLDADNHKSIADSVVVTPKTKAGCASMIGPSVASQVVTSSGVDSVKFTVRNISKANADGYNWTGDLALEVYNAAGDVVYYENNVGLPTTKTTVSGGKTKIENITSYSFTLGNLKAGSYTVAYHIRIFPLVKQGTTTTYVPLLDSFTLNGENTLNIVYSDLE